MNEMKDLLLKDLIKFGRDCVALAVFLSPLIAVDFGAPIWTLWFLTISWLPATFVRAFVNVRVLVKRFGMDYDDF